MSEGQANNRRRWFQLSLRTVLLFLIPYSAFMAWVWTWTPGPLPEHSLWADQIEYAFVKALFPIAQVEAAILATLVFAALLLVPKIVRWIVRRYAP